MTCEEFEDILLDSRHCVGGNGWMFRASRAELVREHVNNCPACSTKMSETTRLEGTLDQLRASTMQIEAPPSVEKKLLEAFRENAARRPSAVGFVFPKLVWVSIAAVALVVASVFLYSKLQPYSVVLDEAKKSSSDRVIPPRLMPELSSAGVPMVSPSLNADKNSRTTTKRRFAPAHKRNTEDNRSPSIVEASNLLSLNGGGSVVRVTLPVSSLIAMGVPVRPDLSESRVTADVWMDPFGAVVGVRLVPASAN